MQLPNRAAREQFTDVQPRHVRGDGPEGSAIFAGSLRLQVVGFQMARPAPHPEQDHRRVARLLARVGPAASTCSSPIPPRASAPASRNSRRCNGPWQNWGRTEFIACAVSAGVFGVPGLRAVVSQARQTEDRQVGPHCDAANARGQFFPPPAAIGLAPRRLGDAEREP